MTQTLKQNLNNNKSKQQAEQSQNVNSKRTFQLIRIITCVRTVQMLKMYLVPFHKKEQKYCKTQTTD
jgi:hypothetical protein